MNGNLGESGLIMLCQHKMLSARHLTRQIKPSLPTEIGCFYGDFSLTPPWFHDTKRLHIGPVSDVQGIRGSTHGPTLLNHHLCPARAGQISEVESVTSPAHLTRLTRHLLSLPFHVLLGSVLHLPVPDA